MSVYLDTSCLLKLFFPEPETRWVVDALAGQRRVVVSDLVRLEAIGQIHGRVEGGALSLRAAKSLMARLEEVLSREPFETITFGQEVVASAEADVRRLPRRAHRRTLDRLHLALARGAGIARVMTSDPQQARAARALGLGVLAPPR